jgi:PKHD-type hydroxylase
MNGEWCYFKSYFSKDYCNELLANALTIPSQDAHVGINGAESTSYESRRSQIRFINSGDWMFKEFFSDLWNMAIQANSDFFNVHITKLDFVQLAEYDSSYKGEYKAHHDVFWINNDPFYHRKLSCIVQLTDPNEYTGGDFELIDTSTFPDASEMRQQGTVIFFPSFFKHQANPVLTGTRYSIASWFEGPKWR